MHKSVMDFVGSIPVGVWEGKSVLEVGSRNINGSVRELIEPFSASYVGVDIAPGEGVDKICDAVNLVRTFDIFAFDHVVSTEMLEHCFEWEYAVTQMKAVCRDSIIVTTRSPGFPRHDHPEDHWRFTKDAMRYAFREFSFTHLADDTEYPGVFMFAERPWPVPDLNKTPYTPERAPIPLGATVAENS